MRGAVRNQERWERRRTPAQDPSTDLAAQSAPSRRYGRNRDEWEAMVNTRNDKIDAEWAETCCIVDPSSAFRKIWDITQVGSRLALP